MICNYTNDSVGMMSAEIECNIPQSKRTTTLVQQRERELFELAQHSPDAIASYDLECRCVYANAEWERVNGVTLGQVRGKRPGEFFGELVFHSPELPHNLETVLETGESCEWDVEWGITHIRYSFRATPEYDALGMGYICGVLTRARNVTKNKHQPVDSVASERVHITQMDTFPSAIGRSARNFRCLDRKMVCKFAYYDALTLLPNRISFNERLQYLIEDRDGCHQRMGLLLLDLDRFKAINEVMGHAAGDELLRETAARLSYCIRDSGTVARLGGDEFAILLPADQADDLVIVANNILNLFSEHFDIENREVYISTSIGIAHYPDDGKMVGDLFCHADSAMYRAKELGRNNFCFYSAELTSEADEKLELEFDLRRGLARGELELFFQPKINLADCVLVGSEALLRWNHPRRGMVSPDKFIGIAEESGLIVEIGEWVLREACKTAREWNDMRQHQVSINLSARQFLANDLAKTVRDILLETKCSPEWIELEITESILLEEKKEILDILMELHAMGISIAIDDFCTGYSSLAYLMLFPIATIKIDQSFTRHITNNKLKAELVKTVISFAKILSQKVVAEGVETAQQANFLHEQGCHHAQGYLYGGAIAKSVLEARLVKEDVLDNL